MKIKLRGPIWLMQPIPYFGEKLEGDWIYEPKIDGWRLQIIRYEDGRVELWGRRLEKRPNWTEKLFYLAKKVTKFLPKGSLLDAELYSEGGRKWIPSLFAKEPKKKPIIYIFDVVFFEGKFIGNSPLRERRKIIEGLKFPLPYYLLKGKPLEDILKHFEEVKRRGYEGLVLKYLDSVYQIGKEAPAATIDWRKVK